MKVLKWKKMIIEKNKPYIKIYRPFMDVTLLLHIIGNTILIYEEGKWIKWSTLKSFQKHWIDNHEEEVLRLENETWLANQYSFFNNEYKLFDDYETHKVELTNINNENLKPIYAKFTNEIPSKTK